MVGYGNNRADFGRKSAMDSQFGTYDPMNSVQARVYRLEPDG
jgi:hypothetical protein